ncbi:MAG: 2,3,4,5-tetrahydropyridine-2,6-dicarboxylate N-succinyltransferase [Bacteroidales bacterium]|jgi:2,3,4,5-tetrahydropyridine-2-carboxylate N-succinyltransferase|nr:2,3,4,5-tetrahydropyridine-2,6-dicarboxylate N-succinyltransferase [Bacteroidales bacterium]MBQ5486780.1 2,3,4,5-tetrahydropyridine-2,6-dicarboxylate N-succinyltransferase [Bacteroidales bacterium]MBR5396808.1 2,3,4,5-tetrahydropyridine-2,6-dicarboxylate N-succinyltransferase [Bacteroidales bacterium]MCR5133191.1 2,3,4,5-tetrahydropyridine-2,6-dicarboxylate N-succinyltransferase [Bacteroidales bacterium]MEE3476768.1 2,3,4,5-tetrahydropyridine-2,6-dicarboxylate N-succinyltransferase [Candidat
MMEFSEVVRRLESGEIRVAEKTPNGWKVNAWVKEAILEGFRQGRLIDMSKEEYSFFDKDTLPLRKFSLEDKVRIVPGGSSVRCGAFLAPSVIMMPPSYVNIGAYVDEGTMVDSHVTIGSCAQVGKHVHVSAATQIGGVLEPAGALPVIIEDNAFVGGNCGIYEGTIVEESAVIGSGVIITAGTPLFDATKGDFVPKSPEGKTVVPAGAVVVAGSRPVTKGPGKDAGIHLYCPVIVKYRDGRTAASVELETLLR